MNFQFEKEEGMFGEESVIWWAMAAITTISLFIFVYLINIGVATMAWKGFLYLMKPDNLFPNILNLPDYEKNKPTGIMGMFSGAVYLNGIIMKYIVNGLVVIMFYLVGMIYLYSDLFESFLGKMKSIVPRAILSLILAYGSLYIIQFLLIMGKYAYLVLYNIHVGSLGAWQDPNFITGGGAFSPHFAPPDNSSIWGWVESLFLKYIWSFLSLDFSIMLLMTVAVRDVAFAVLIVLAPIAGILLLTPWTQQIGSRIWYLLIDLIFLPFVMIIPLMVIGPVNNRISFVIAGLVVSMGAIYLISKEPLMLRGIGFGTAGGHLSRGVTMGVGMGNMFGGMGMTRASMTTPGGDLIGGGGGLKGGISDKAGGGTGEMGRFNAGLHGAMTGGKGVYDTTKGHIGAGLGVFGTYTLARGGKHIYEHLKAKKGGK